MTKVFSKKLLLVATGAIILIAAAVLVVCIARHDSEKTKEANVPLGYALLEGTLESEEVDVSTKIPGRIAYLSVDEGDLVKAGQVIGMLESKEVDSKVAQAYSMYQAAKTQQSQAEIGIELQAKTVNEQVKQAEAAYRAAKAKLEMALNGARPQEVAQAKAAADQANAAYKTAKDSYDRFHGLYEAGVIPKQQEEEVELKYLSAKAAKEAAEAKLSLVKEGARREEIEQAREGVRAAEAQLRMAKDAVTQVALRRKEAIAAGYKAAAAKGQLDEALAFKSETEIIAPISGYVSERISEPGEMISAGFPILSIVKDKDFKVKVYADESKFGSLDLNSKVKVIIPALNNREFDARVIRISPSADFATKKATNEQGSFDVRSLEVVVAIQGDHSDLRNGMTARVQLPYSRRK